MASFNRVKFQHKPASSDGHSVSKNRSNTDFAVSGLTGLNLNTIEISNSAPGAESNGILNGSSTHRTRSQTDRLQSSHATQSPRLNGLMARPPSSKWSASKRPTVERTSVPNMWVHSTSNSVFSMHGMEAMLRKLNGTESGTNSPVTGAASLPPSRHGSIIGRTKSNISNQSAESPSSPLNSPPFRGNSPPHMRPRKSSEQSNRNGIGFGAMSLVMNPSLDSSKDGSEMGDWEDRIKKWETEGDWIECRESLTGRVLWYNTASYRMIFDSPPDGVTQLPSSQYTLSSEILH